eukprot:CAMPEP_0168732158 /NCGR_PEP_ID=MMETSP0724-20121128/7631_1 /TAXON_ID=265536 /ORGANISM="Amphiprora sp., Strain CCMP467" /LENGTH=695 /DNA_ID=CAMNT_0008779177 /DNA_START=1965 /DNA_END=4052 /DNA_ORIENTATION=+
MSRGAFDGAALAAAVASERSGARSMLQERLDDVLVLELLKDGGRNYLTLSVRSLYKHVLAAITGPSDTITPMTTIPETPSHVSHSDNVHWRGVSIADKQPEPTPEQEQEQSTQDVNSTSTINLPEAHVMIGSLTAPDDAAPDATQFPPPPLTPAPPPLTPAPPLLTPTPPLLTPAHQSSPSLASPTPSTKSYDRPTPAPSRLRQRSKSVSVNVMQSTMSSSSSSTPQEEITYRERLGGYLHPRDMRRLVTPFSASNEPEIIVRRHVMLLNFDPLRAIILRDRLLILIPDGADSMLVDLERRVRGGSKELEAAIFGMDATAHDSNPPGSGGGSDNNTTLFPSSDHSVASENEPSETSKAGNLFTRVWNFRHMDSGDSSGTDGGPGNFLKESQHSLNPLKKRSSSDNLNRINSSKVKKGKGISTTQQNAQKDAVPPTDSNSQRADDEHQSEWDDLQGKEWIQLPFELQCADAVLHTVTTMLTDDTDELQAVCLDYIEGIIGGKASNEFKGEDPLTIIRAIKDSVREMSARVKSFVKSMNDTLDDYEDMALMNLSRLLTHPEKFIQPVPAEVLEEESDEPELILESYLQNALSLVNVLDLIQGQIDTAAELIDQKLDAARNKILLANTVITMVALCVQLATMVAGYFGMNLINHLEDSENAFLKVTFWSIGLMMVMFFAMMAIMYKTGALPSWHSSGF